MKKSLITAAAIAIIGAAGYAVINSNSQQREFSELELANIEALTGNEFNDCHFTNGYREWKTEQPWWWSDQKSFYDCCQILQTGYSPDGECR